MVGDVSLSSRLYANAQKTSTLVQSLVQNHVQGFQDARALALELYEGYDFNPTEPLNLKPGNQALPQHLRELLKDGPTANELQKAYTKAQVKALRTPALKAAYTQLLDAIDNVEAGVGAKRLDNALKVAFNEKLRYFSNRIAQTEQHRAYAEEQAREFMADPDVEYVRWELNPAHPVEDICDYFANVNRFDLGPGIYPVAQAPVAPAHPYCKCVLVPTFAFNGQEAVEVDGAEAKYFDSLPPNTARLVAGSEKKLDRVKAGESAWKVHNSKTDPIYQVKTVGDVS